MQLFKVLTIYLFLLIRVYEAADASARRNLVANRVIRNSYRKYFVPRVDITSYNVLIDGKKFFLINRLMIQLENMMKLERSRLEKEIIT